MLCSGSDRNSQGCYANDDVCDFVLLADYSLSLLHAHRCLPGVAGGMLPGARRLLSSAGKHVVLPRDCSGPSRSASGRTGSPVILSRFVETHPRHALPTRDDDRPNHWLSSHCGGTLHNLHMAAGTTPSLLSCPTVWMG